MLQLIINKFRLVKIVTMNIKCLSVLILLTLIMVLLCVLKTLDHQSVKKTSHHTKTRTPKSLKLVPPKTTVPQRIVHLDLKGAPPKVSYYTQFFPLLKQLGATGILVQYEDMFPYNSPMLQNISALNAYSRNDIRTLNSLAKNNSLKVIPYIETFNSLDFVLKLEQFIDYREVRNFPSTICPSYKKSLNLLELMIEEVINAHPGSDMIHIGCGSVQYLGQCNRCRDRMQTNNLTKNQIFFLHINSVVSIIRQIKPSMRILMWDNHFRALNDGEMVENRHFLREITPVVGWYDKDVYDELGPSLWEMYSKMFGGVWVAGAFKGSAGSNKYISDVNHYIQNQKGWLSVIEEYQQKVRFEGIILTGWQRYDHFAVLCEFLPVAIPALAMSLRLLQGFKDSALGPPVEVAKILRCQQPYGLIGSAFGSPKCKFPGGDILENLIHFHQLQQDFAEITEDFRVKGWLSEYQIMRAFSNPKHVKAVGLPLEKIKNDLSRIPFRIAKSLGAIYDQNTVEEWLQTYLKPFEHQVLMLWEAKEKILQKSHWSRRPLNSHREDL